MNSSMTIANRISDLMTESVFLPIVWKGRTHLMERRQNLAPWKPAICGVVCIVPVAEQSSTCQTTQVSLSRWEREFTPRTELGRKLYALRMRAIASGMKLLSQDEVLEEVKRRRGETAGNETNLY